MKNIFYYLFLKPRYLLFNIIAILSIIYVDVNSLFIMLLLIALGLSTIIAFLCGKTLIQQIYYYFTEPIVFIHKKKIWYVKNNILFSYNSDYLVNGEKTIENYKSIIDKNQSKF